MKKIKLHWWILLGVLLGVVLGTVVHLAYREEARVAVLGQGYDPERLKEPAVVEQVSAQLETNLGKTSVYQAFDGLADIFLRLLRMIVVPLVFFSLVAGIAGLGDISRLGRIGVKTFGYYMLTSCLAILTGLIFVNVIRPGADFEYKIGEAAAAAHLEGIEDKTPGSFWEVLSNMIPRNVVEAAANFDLLGVIVFTVFFGVFLLAIAEEKRKQMTGFIEAGAEVMMKMTHFIISLAPVGIAALIARMVSKTGPEVFIQLIWYVVTVFSALMFHLLVTLPAVLYLRTRRNPYRYLQAMSSALLTAFSTASSSGTLAVTMDRAEEAGVSKRITSFTLPIGATVNMDGTALYEIVSVLFIAQVHAFNDPAYVLTFGEQMMIVFLGLMVSIGAAGIPHAGLIMMVIILEAVGLPAAYTGLVWTVDRVLDMCRTMVNVGSDSTVAMVIAHGEGEVNPPGDG